MNTEAIHDVIQKALEDGSCSIADAANAMRQLRAIERAQKRADKVRKFVWRMFDDGVLDPYPTSDTSDEYRLREATGWIPKDERKAKKERTK
jgi:hypothetical protein